MKYSKQILVAILVLLMLISPIALQAQEATEQVTQEVIATQIAPTPAPQPTNPSEAGDNDLSGVFTIIGTVALVIVLGGSFFLAITALEALKVSVPKETLDNISEQVVTTMRETMDTLQQQVESTITPVDDAIFSVGRIPIERLIEELNSRTMTPEQSAKAYQAIQRTLDDTLTNPMQGTAYDDPLTNPPTS